MSKCTFPLNLGVVLFEGFELLDVFGPLEMFGMLPNSFTIHLIAEHSNPVASAQGPASVINQTFSAQQHYNILLVPGGQGTRREVKNNTLLEWLKNRSEQAAFVTSVCTGSALLARSGVLNGRRATTNKRAFQWVASQSAEVNWIPEARWVEDGKYFTSSGVSAGMDMALGLIEKILGRETSDQVANQIEYEWHSDASWDPFAQLNGLVNR